MMKNFFIIIQAFLLVLFPFFSQKALAVETTNSVTDRFYTGQIKDDSGLYYYNARYYDPQLGIFTSADRSQGPNRYAYVGGNPIMKNDPTGNMMAEDSGGRGLFNFKDSWNRKWSDEEKHKIASLFLDDPNISIHGSWIRDLDFNRVAGGRMSFVNGNAQWVTATGFGSDMIVTDWVFQSPYNGKLVDDKEIKETIVHELIHTRAMSEGNNLLQLLWQYRELLPDMLIKTKNFGFSDSDLGKFQLAITQGRMNDIMASNNLFKDFIPRTEWKGELTDKGRLLMDYKKFGDTGSEYKYTNTGEYMACLGAEFYTDKDAFKGKYGENLSNFYKGLFELEGNNYDRRAP